MGIRTLGHVWFLFLKIIFENTKNTTLMLFENYHCSLNLVFYMFLCFSEQKKN